MSNLVDLVREKIDDSVKVLGYEIYHIEYVNELGHNYLRIMITKQDINDKITIKDCEIVSKTINSLIDELSENNNKFFLEVSSPGINRKLYTFEHRRQAIGQQVCVRLNKSLNESKRHIGVLKDVTSTEVFIKTKSDDLKIDVDIIKNMNLEEISQEDIHE